MSVEATTQHDLRLLLIGGAPSSGSTLLADMLDSITGVVCGPESGLFASRRSILQDNHTTHQNPISLDNLSQKELADSFSRIFPWSATPSCCSHGIGFKHQVLDRYGAGLHDTLKLRIASPNHIEFARQFLAQYAQYRGKTTQVFCEKTPENVHTARILLDLIPDAGFIHIVRHPLFAIQSLFTRGVPLHVAVATWLIDAAAGHALSNHPRCMTIRYEDITANPFETVAQLAQRAGVTTTANQLEEAFIDNCYRKRNRSDIKSWKAKTYGRIIDCNTIEDHDLAKAIMQTLKTYHISKLYAFHFELQTTDYTALSHHFGYEIDRDSGFSPAPPRREKRRSLHHLFAKWRTEHRIGDASIFDLYAYLNPLS